MQRILCSFLLSLMLSGTAISQEQKLRSGPMVGYSEMREVLLWVQTHEQARVQIFYRPKGSEEAEKATAEVLTRKRDAFTAKLIADRVEPGMVYTYRLTIDGTSVALDYPLEFRTQELWHWRHDPPAFTFALGSCAYINETVYDRPGRPYGADYEIFSTILEKNPAFMLWLGDNVYLREADWYSRTGIFERYSHTRAVKELQPLLGSVHHYAIWDDHDYGPNNSDRSFRNKATTLEAFTKFWGNPTFGIDGEPGTATTFEWADVQFFLLDNRYYRSPNDRLTGERTILGEKQRRWLIDALVSSQAPFKFVVIGGQVLNPVARFENHATFAEEREWLIRTITAEGISGVFFLTGDRHHTELSKLPRRGHYPLYDLTVSPLTAGPNTRSRNEGNRLRVEGTNIHERNFATITVSGPRKDRVLKITVFNTAGKELWSREIRAQDLR